MRICSRCHYVGKPVLVRKGSTALEIMLWLLLVIPGLLYTVWRQTNQYYGCPKCATLKMAPVNSLRGKKLLRRKEKGNVEIEIIKYDN